MKSALLAVLGTLTLAAPGCVGEFTTGGPPSDINTNPNNDTTPPAGADAGAPAPTGDDATARALFEANVAPIVTLNCANGGCHLSQAPAFVSASPTTAYDTAILHRDSLFANFEATGSRLLENGANSHQGAAIFTAGDVAAISGWLAQEKLDAEAGGGVQASALAEFSGCMTLANFEASNMADEWADKNAGNQGDCDACHNLGADGFMASNQDARMFSYISGEATGTAQFMPSYFTLDATGTSVVINRARLEGVGNQISPHENHGNFNLDANDDAMIALQQFYDATMLLKAQGQCGLPKF